MRPRYLLRTSPKNYRGRACLHSTLDPEPRTLPLKYKMSVYRTIILFVSARTSPYFLSSSHARVSLFWASTNLSPSLLRESLIFSETVLSSPLRSLAIALSSSWIFVSCLSNSHNLSALITEKPFVPFSMYQHTRFHQFSSNALV